MFLYRRGALAQLCRPSLAQYVGSSKLGPFLFLRRTTLRDPRAATQALAVPSVHLCSSEYRKGNFPFHVGVWALEGRVRSKVPSRRLPPSILYVLRSRALESTYEYDIKSCKAVRTTKHLPGLCSLKYYFNQSLYMGAGVCNVRLC